MKTKALRAAFPHTIPVMTGYLFLGIAFGVLLSAKGYHTGWAILMSVCIYAGAMQFVAIGLLTSAFSVVSAAFLTLMVNARHVFYGLSMLGKFRDMGGKKPYMIFSLTDETYSLLCSVKPPEGVDRKWFLFFIALLDHSYWILGGIIGSVVGSLFPFDSTGIDFVMTALFAVILIEQWEQNKNHAPALIGVFSSLLCLLVFGAERFLIPAMLLMLAIFFSFRKKLEKRDYE